MNGGFKDLVEKTIYYGSLAPSAHNTQPWKFKRTGDSIELILDPERTLGYSDPRKWETYLSIGACLTNILEATKAMGILQDAILFPDDKDQRLIARVTVNQNNNEKKIDEERLKVIENRQTNRSNYLPKKIPEEFIKRWEKIAQESSVGCFFISEPNLIKEISDLQYEATLLAFSDPKFREELSTWVRHNLTKAHDGMPGYINNIPLPVSFLGPWMIRNIDIGKMQGGIERKWLRSAPLIMILTLKNADPKNLVEAGKAFEQIAIDIFDKGAVYAPLGALIEMPQVNEKLRKLLKIDTTPVMLVRIGYSDKKYKKAPKRTVREVLES